MFHDCFSNTGDVSYWRGYSLQVQMELQMCLRHADVAAGQQGAPGGARAGSGGDGGQPGNTWRAATRHQVGLASSNQLELVQKPTGYLRLKPTGTLRISWTQLHRVS
jgi:hypothetical protein